MIHKSPAIFYHILVEKRTKKVKIYFKSHNFMLGMPLKSRDTFQMNGKHLHNIFSSVVATLVMA